MEKKKLQESSTLLAALQLIRQPFVIDSFFLLHAKPFYKRIALCVAVTLIHVINEASESFRKMHEKILWQEK